MPRPKKFSDEALLRAAQRVLDRRGADGFTLSEAAEVAGLSRAAITLRFKSVGELRLRLAARDLERLENSIGSIPVERSGDCLIALAAYLGALPPVSRDVAREVASSQKSLEDQQLKPIFLKQRDIVRAAIAERMPDSVLSLDEAVNSFIAHLVGSVTNGPRAQLLAEHIIEQTELWLSMAQIPFRSRADNAALIAASLAVAQNVYPPHEIIP